MSLLTDTFCFENFLYCQQDHFGIELRADMIHVVNIQFKFFFPANGIAAIHLCPASDTWSYFMASVCRGL